MKNNIICVADARRAAKRRMPKIMFDYIDGAAGSEYACEQNAIQLNRIRLLPRVLVDVENRRLDKTLMGKKWSFPFGIAPMGMCNLTWPGADRMLAAAAVKYDIPIALSTMASSSIETMRKNAGGKAWFQLYVGASEDSAFAMVKRAEVCGYDTLILTVDVPKIGSRPRELRNGFQSPMKIRTKQFLDFATHPQWSIRTMIAGVPKIANNEHEGSAKIVRDESRGKVDWAFLDRLRARWPGKLIVKGVLSPQDAVRIADARVDAIYVSNHGGRQLDAAPVAIKMLPLIRAAVGESYPLIFDSGLRNGEGIIKALALGADFVMLGRPLLYGIGAAGAQGLEDVIDLIVEQMDNTLAQIGQPDINQIDRDTALDFEPYR